MTILVTGANGFIGSALCESLRKGAVSVRGVMREGEAHILGAENIAIGHISKETDWTQALKNVEQVVHLAARVHVMNETGEDALAEFRRVNVEGTARLARQAAAAGVKRFLFLSSIKVNGEFADAGQCFTALDQPSPQDPYGVSKYEAEQQLWRIAGETGMEVVVIRPPLVFGPGVKGNFLHLLQAVDKRWPLPFGRIQNRRSLVYLGNLVDAIRLCLTHPEAAGRVFLVSDGDDVSTAELVRRIAAPLRRNPCLLSLPVSWIRWVGEVLGKQAAVDRLLGSLCVDITPLRDELGWKPPYSMQMGLEVTVRWYRNHRGAV